MNFQKIHLILAFELNLSNPYFMAWKSRYILSIISLLKNRKQVIPVDDIGFLRSYAVFDYL